MDSTDTIAAIATPAGEGGIGIIRISGPGALAAARRVFISADSRVPAGAASLGERRLVYGRMVEVGEIPGDGGAEPASRYSVIDDGFAVFMPGPRSYTGEDVVELHCHGGTQILARILEAVLGSGSRPAAPGEFTRRAFLNSRMDLTQAEAVIDVIRASTASALTAARSRLTGGLSARVNAVKDGLATLLARIEAALDFPEEEDVNEDGEQGTGRDDLLAGFERATAALAGLIGTYELGGALKDGVRALILGRPNTGKSSLLNILLKEERAIVTEIPGTTRDVIEEVINIKGLSVRLMDTAGLRETTDFIESLGVAAARGRIEAANLLLFVIDASEVSREDLSLLGSVEGKEGRPVLVVANKVDLIDNAGRKEVESFFKKREKRGEGRRISFISALTGEGLEGLEEAIHELVTGGPPGGTVFAETVLVASLRQKTALEDALVGVGQAAASAKKSMPPEFVAADLRRALNRLGEITGEVTTEDILDKIFSEFCIGK